MLRTLETHGWKAKYQKYLIFFSTLFNIYPNTSEEHEGLENEHEESEIGKHYQQWKLKSQTLLQILYYNTFRGAWKTPFHIMVGDSVHEKSKSKSLITSLNHAGLSVSYPEVILHHHNLAQDALKQSPSEVKMQSHFKADSYTIGAFDNFDYEEATLSGVGGSHDTVCVLFQDKPIDISLKLSISDTDVKQGQILPWQKL